MSNDSEKKEEPKMKYRRLGISGLRVSALSLGTWVTAGAQINDEVMINCIKTAFESGVNFFDTAEIYAQGEAEVVLGKAIKENNWKRSDLVISTKIIKGGDGENDIGLSRKHVIEGLNASLKRLQLDYVDLVYAHRPDKMTPIEETVRAFDYLINSGKAFYWGTSEWSAVEILEAHKIARQYNLIPPTMEQPQYNMFVRDRVEREYHRLYQDDLGLGLTIWSPLKYGILTGKYSNGIPEGSRLALEKFKDSREGLTSETGKAQIEKVKKLSKIAEKIGCTMAQLALAWCLRNKRVSSVIMGASRPQQVTENIASLQFVDKITDEVNEEIEKILDNKPAIKYYFEKRDN